MQRTIILLQFRRPLLSATGCGLEAQSLEQFATLAKRSLLRESGPVWSWTLPWERTMAPLVENSISPAPPCMESSPVATDSLDIRLEISLILTTKFSPINRVLWLLRPQALHGEGKAGESQHIKDIVDP